MMVGPLKVLATPAMPPPTGWLLLLPAAADGGCRGVVRILLIKFTAWLPGAAFPPLFCGLGNGAAELPGSAGWVGAIALGWVGLIGLIAPFEGMFTPLFGPLLAFRPLFAGLLGSNGTLVGGCAGVV